MPSGTPLSLRIYGLAAAGIAGLAPAWLRRRLARGREDPARWTERLGVASRPRPPGPLVWLHGVSVGEALSLLPLVERLRLEHPEAGILFTSGTRASAELLGERLGPGAVHQYVPLDTPGAVRAFLDHWRPDVGVFVESDLWPNLILGARARGVKLALLSAKLSERSAANWRRAPGAARALVGAFDLVMARDAASAAALKRLGARVDGLADLKFGAPELPVDAADLAKARAAVAGRPVILAASTHPGEERLVLKAFKAARTDQRPLLIIVPRHPIRGPGVQNLAADAGFSAGLRSAGDSLGEHEVYVADTVGELGLWYRLATLAVVGGSLIASGAGGHNPLEPARLACPFIAGPYTRDWPVYEALEARGATRREEADNLLGWFSRAFAAPTSLRAIAARARTFAREGDAAAAGVADRVLGLLVR